MAKVKKRKNADEYDTSIFRIMFLLVNSDRFLSVSEISNATDLRPNLVCYHLNVLKKKHLVLEDGETYSCQPFLRDEDILEDIDNLLMLIIKIFAGNMVIESPTEKELGKAVLENLRIYLDVFEIDVI